MGTGASRAFGGAPVGSLDTSIASSEDAPYWPSLRIVLALGFAAAIAVAIDTYFNAQAGILARAPGYDGVGYMISARQEALLLRGVHPHQALIHFPNFVPLWSLALTVQYFILGDGTWQAFTARFWAVGPLLVLVYWIVRRRTNSWLAIAATLITAVLPLVSAGVRSSSLEFFSGQADYGAHWYLDDLRPDFLAGVLALWSIAILAEDKLGTRRSVYLVSPAFAAAAVLAKPSTSPAVLAVWAVALGLHWFWHRSTPNVFRHTAMAGLLACLLILPWGVFSGGALLVVNYLHAISVSYGATYAIASTFPDNFTYFVLQLPDQLGQVEIWLAIIGALALTVGIWRRQLGRAEASYAITAVLWYLIFSIPSTKNPHLGIWISLAIWLFLSAALARLITSDWTPKVARISPAVAGMAAAYVAVVYALGAIAIANWPVTERHSSQEQLAVTVAMADELKRYVSLGQCFTYAPGPGWPASLQYQMMDPLGNTPMSTAIDVDPSVTSIADYIKSASKCQAVIAYRENITKVAQLFYAPPVRQPYLQALADWVRSPDSGFRLDQSWRFSDLTSDGAHPLGQTNNGSLTVDLYVRST